VGEGGDAEDIEDEEIPGTVISKETTFLF